MPGGLPTTLADKLTNAELPADAARLIDDVILEKSEAQSSRTDITGVVASTNSGKVLSPSDELLDLGTVYDSNRKEVKYTDAGAIRLMFSTLRNPTGKMSQTILAASL